MQVSQLINSPDTTAGRVFDWVVLFLIIYSILTLSVETLPNLSPTIIRICELSEIFTTLLFTLEYFLRVIAAKRKTDYVFSFYGIIDLAAILPFYLALGLDLRALRAVRLLRLFRLLKLGRYNKAVARLGQAFREAKEELVIFLFATFVVLYFAGAGIYYFEHQAQPEQFKSIFHSLWWAVTTLTTVGYGDVYPITAGGRIFTFLVLMCGLGIAAVPAGIVAATLSNIVRTGRSEE